MKFLETCRRKVNDNCFIGSLFLIELSSYRHLGLVELDNKVACTRGGLLCCLESIRVLCINNVGLLISQMEFSNKILSNLVT